MHTYYIYAEHRLRKPKYASAWDSRLISVRVNRLCHYNVPLAADCTKLYGIYSFSLRLDPVFFFCFAFHCIEYTPLHCCYCYSPIVLRQTWRIPEALRKRIRVDLELGDELILVCGHRGEYGLREHERLVLVVLKFTRWRWHRLAATQSHEMDAWLITMHWVEDDLRRTIMRERGWFVQEAGSNWNYFARNLSCAVFLSASECNYFLSQTFANKRTNLPNICVYMFVYAHSTMEPER